MKPIRQLIRRLLDTAIDWWTEIVALILLVVGLVGYFRGSEPYVPIFTEVIGIGIAVLIIDLSNKFLAIRNEKKRLILQMGSPDNAFAREAVRQLRARDWLEDGSLRGAYLMEADLREANLKGANLEGVRLTLANLMDAILVEANMVGANLIFSNLEGANLKEANLGNTILEQTILVEANMVGAILERAYLNRAVLYQANLERAILVRADLREAKLWEVNMAGANLWQANLKGANLEGAYVILEQLAEAESLEGAIMPDGTVYNPETFKEKLEERETSE